MQSSRTLFHRGQLPDRLERAVNNRGRPVILASHALRVSQSLDLIQDPALRTVWRRRGWFGYSRAACCRSPHEAGGGGGGRLMRHRAMTIATITTSPNTASMFMSVLSLSPPRRAQRRAEAVDARHKRQWWTVAGEPPCSRSAANSCGNHSDEWHRSTTLRQRLRMEGRRRRFPPPWSLLKRSRIPRLES